METFCREIPGEEMTGGNIRKFRRHYEIARQFESKGRLNY